LSTKKSPFLAKIVPLGTISDSRRLIGGAVSFCRRAQDDAGQREKSIDRLAEAQICAFRKEWTHRESTAP
jgi:hypothetical protein